MSEVPSLADRLRAKLINEAPLKAEWASKNMAFVCPAELALVSDLSQDELVEIFDSVFVEFVSKAKDNNGLQKLVTSEARYAVSRIADRCGKEQILPHINIDCIFAPDGKVRKETAEKFGLFHRKDPAGEEYTLAKLLGTENTNKNNHAQQIINMMKEHVGVIAKIVSLPVAMLVVAKDLFYKSPAGTHFIRPAAKPLFEKLRASYKPLVTTYTMMSIVPEFQDAEQRFTYQLTICERDMKVDKAKPVSIKPKDVNQGGSIPGVTRF